MSNVHRLHTPDNRTINLPAPASTVIEVGDLTWWDSANELVKPASSQADAGSEVLNQLDFARNFAGVSNQQRISGQTTAGTLTVLQEGVFQYPCPATDWAAGDLIGASENAGGDGLEDQQVEKVTSPALAIGVCIEGTAAGATLVKGFFAGKVLHNALTRLDRGIGNFQGQAATTLADAAVVLTVDANPVLNMVPTAARNVDLPAEAKSKGLLFFFTNNSAGANTVTFRSSAAGAIKGNGAVPQNKTGIFWCDGTNWNGCVSA